MGNKTFSERVRSERNKKGVTIEKLASDLGLQKSRVAMWENAGTVPRSETLLALCEYFGVSADYLLGNGNKEEVFKNGKIKSIERMLQEFSPEEVEQADDILRAAFRKKFGGNKGV